MKNNKLLIQGDYPLIASPTLAQAYGVASAIFLQKLHYCLQHHADQKKYFYHSYEQWVETLGMYSISTIKRVVSKLKKLGILVVKKLAQNKWLQTNFYSINYRKLRTLLKEQTQPDTINIKPTGVEKQEARQTVQNKPTAQLITVAKTTISASCTQPTITLQQGLVQPIHPLPSAAYLANMPAPKRQLYQQLRKLRIDIDYMDVRLEQWLKHQQFIIQKAAYLKDQLGHLKALWYRPEQLGLTVP